MSGLAEAQDAMLARILDEDLPLPAGWTPRHAAGLAVYRNNYRSALVEALRSTFERTARLVGEDSFERAAAHHVITHPPASWTLDLAGEGFDATCAQLFAHDPEVAELAWLEWAMHRAFVARDTAALDGAGFAATTASYGDADWAGLRLRFVPGIALRTLRHDVKRLWSDGETHLLEEAACCIVWREGERPVFQQVPLPEGEALSAMVQGASFAEACELLSGLLGEDEAPAAAGAMLARWLAEGLVETLAQ